MRIGRWFLNLAVLLLVAVWGASSQNSSNHESSPVGTHGDETALLPLQGPQGEAKGPQAPSRTAKHVQSMVQSRVMNKLKAWVGPSTSSFNLGEEKADGISPALMQIISQIVAEELSRQSEESGADTKSTAHSRDIGESKASSSGSCCTLSHALKTLQEATSSNNAEFASLTAEETKLKESLIKEMPMESETLTRAADAQKARLAREKCGTSGKFCLGQDLTASQQTVRYCDAFRRTEAIKGTWALNQDHDDPFGICDTSDGRPEDLVITRLMSKDAIENGVCLPRTALVLGPGGHFSYELSKEGGKFDSRDTNFLKTKQQFDHMPPYIQGDLGGISHLPNGAPPQTWWPALHAQANAWRRYAPYSCNLRQIVVPCTL